ncbi:MAG TPA: SPOR domain-containing protein [Oleiagrimonas sp.]|nr:SPOR domain-containing protein [Oleiagrimonas sp.]
MARKGKQAVRNGGLPAWLLVVIGIVVGAIGMFAVLQTGHMPISRPDNAPQPTAAASSENDGGRGIAAKKQDSEPRYDFYSVLPQKEVVIPDAQIDAQIKAEQQAASEPESASASNDTAKQTTGSTASSSAKGEYLLQVASFPDASDADALKARLALNGFRAEVEQVTIKGETWNRVRLGPYTSATALEADRKKLEAQGFHAIALKERK